jgi:hypothetical protein
VGYPRNTCIASFGTSPDLAQFQIQIIALIEHIQELTKAERRREQVWCTSCKVEGNHANEWCLLRGGVAQDPPIGPFLGISLGGVVQESSSWIFQNMQEGYYFEICKGNGHPSQHCPILQKHSSILINIHYEFCRTNTHNIKNYRALKHLTKIMEKTSFQVKDNSQPQGGGGRGQGGKIDGRS